ncbi:MAG: hypothetical protein R3272_01195 [Candidatus Promineifilaceae bacterium]|nr:hypothetical protein [Candidatus Promineifilaceae bacterium]
MKVQYDDGSVAELNIAIQKRIWENIRDEEEVRAATRAARQADARSTHYYIKSLSMETEEEVTVPGFRERITVVEREGPALHAGDRIVYYALEDHVFFAVGTVTGEAQGSVPKGFFYTEEEAQHLRFYPIDLDEQVDTLERALPLESVELESNANYRSLLQRPNSYFEINEDDFELLAELLTEVTEEEDEDFEDEEDEEDYEE